MKVVDAGEVIRKPSLAGARAGANVLPARVMAAAGKIFSAVAAKGPKALFDYTREFDRCRISEKTIRVSEAEIKKARSLVSAEDLEVFKIAVKRITDFHCKLKPKATRYNDGRGTVIEERPLPLDRAGLCIPGGRAPLASTVFMTAIPAKIAGVGRLVMISPWPGGRMSPHLIAAADLAGVDEIYKVGGVQGVAALATGAALIPKVEKIVGPGSVWVTAGKAIAVSRGLCGIDSLAGPSEVVVVADARANPAWIAADLASQAEHGEDSVAILVATSAETLKKVETELERLARGGEGVSGDRVFAVPTATLDEAAAVINAIAPEHLEIMVSNPRQFALRIKNAGGIFIGPYSPVPAGDYMAGANHVLPTGGTARWSSPLAVADFMKRQTITTLDRDALKKIAGPAARMAEIEGLPAHARSVRKRFKK